jgi:hypothetical protein
MYAASEKFLIFSKSGLTLSHIGDGLEFLNIRHKITTKIPVEMMMQDVITFETSDIFRVYLMELKHGARGL